MKIKSIKWQEHPILGNLELDFNDASTGKLHEIIIFVGENGVGKSAIFNSVGSFLNNKEFHHFKEIKCIFNDNSYKILANQRTYSIYPEDYISGDYTLNPEANIKLVPFIYSKARADFKTKEIIATTAITIDKEKKQADVTDDFTNLKQLLIDLQSQDYQKFAEESQKEPILWANFDKNSKSNRFKSAFNNFFKDHSLIYEGVKDLDTQKKVIFKKYDKEVNIDDLSTGEKQIVFRGIYLLDIFLN